MNRKLLSLFVLAALCALCASPSSVHAQKYDPTSKFGVRHVKISLTAAQLAGMYAAPVKILDPQGAGKSIIVTKAVFTMTRTATAFAGGGVIIAQYGSTVNGGGQQALDSTMPAADLTTASAATTLDVRNGAVISTLAASSIQNAPLYFSNQTAAFTTGTGGATFDVWYYVLF